MGSVRFPSAECPFFCSFTSWCSRESANENHTKPRNAVVGCLAYPERADTAVQSQLLGTGDGDGDPRHRERCLDRGGAITLLRFLPRLQVPVEDLLAVPVQHALVLGDRAVYTFSRYLMRKGRPLM